jgi:hypothetical protein
MKKTLSVLSVLVFMLVLTMGASAAEPWYYQLYDVGYETYKTNPPRGLQVDWELKRSSLYGLDTFIFVIRGSGGGSTSGYLFNSNRAAGGGGSSMACRVTLKTDENLTLSVGEGGYVTRSWLWGPGQDGGNTYLMIKDQLILMVEGGGGASRCKGGRTGSCGIGPFTVDESNVGETFDLTYAAVEMLAYFPGAEGGQKTGSYGAAGYGSFIEPDGETLTAPQFTVPSNVETGAGGIAPKFGFLNGNVGSMGQITIYG